MLNRAGLLRRTLVSQGETPYGNHRTKLVLQDHQQGQFITLCWHSDEFGRRQETKKIEENKKAGLRCTEMLCLVINVFALFVHLSYDVT